MLWVMLVTSFVLAIAVLIVDWRTRSHDGLAMWGWGLMAHGLSYPAFALRFGGYLATSILVSNLLTSLTIALHTLAVHRFQRDRAPRLSVPLVWGPVLLAGVGALALLEQHQVRLVYLSALGAAQSAYFCWLAWAPGLEGERERSRALLVAGSLCLTLMFLLRGLMLIVGDEWDREAVVPDELQARTYLASIVILLLNTVGYVLMQKERAVEQQHQEATHDALTGVFNRRALMAEIERHISLASRQGASLAALMLDIAHFKLVNDRHGHQVGDAVLREMALRIGQRLRQHDVLGRYGGEEFVIVLPVTTLDGALALADDIRAAVAATPFKADGQSIALTASIGVHARVPVAVAEFTEAMIAGCDRALYAAKQAGRNCVCAEP